MWRWLNWAARILATAVLLSFLSIWTTGYIVNSYMETLLKQLNLPLETQPFALSGIWGTLWGANPVPQAEDEANGEGGNPVLDLESLQLSTNGEHDTGGRDDALNAEGDSFPAHSPGLSDDEGLSGGLAAGEGSNGGTAGSSPDKAGEYAGGSASTPADADSQGSGPSDEDAVPVFSGEDNASAAMSDEQRQALNAIMSKLNGEQLSALSGYLKDGLTDDELVAVRELLKPALTESEYAKMMEILEPRHAKSDESTDNTSENRSESPKTIP